MSANKVHKVRKTKLQRFWRFLGALFNPYALAHGFKVLNYYNYSHVAELRKAQVGPGCGISPTASFANGQNIVIGARTAIGAYSSLWAGPGQARIVLDEDVLIAPNVMITASNYRFNDGGPVAKQAMDEAEITIGKDVWIGYGAVVLAGAQIGAGAIIGAGALVRGKVAPGAIVASPLAQPIGQRADTALPGGVAPAAPVSAPEGRLQRRYGPNAPHMAASGLSEAWLFKELGDIHRTLSADAAPEAGALGFARIQLEATPCLGHFAQTGPLQIAAQLTRSGEDLLVSHGISVPGQAAGQAVGQGFQAQARSLSRSAVPGASNGAQPRPDFAAAHDARQAAAPAPEIFHCSYELQPPHDLDGAGRLCFAAYPAVFDLCLERSEGAGFLKAHSTAGRDIYYFDPPPPAEALLFRLHGRTELPGGLIRHTASLVRHSDGTRIAEMISLKHPLTGARR